MRVVVVCTGPQVVFYGSQTGTAEEFAGRLAKEGARCGLGVST